jgi:ADP-heptose:LPS heptosyltransferase
MNLRFIRFIDLFIGVPLVYLCGWLKRSLQSKKSAAENTGLKKKILLVKFWGTGNIIMLLPATAALKEKYPDSRIDLLTLFNNAAVAQASRQFEHIYLVSITSFSGFSSSVIKSLLALRKVDYDIVIDFEQFARFSALFCMLIGRKVTVGFTTSGQHRLMAYSKTVTYNNNLHMAESFFSLIRHAGASTSARLWKSPVPLNYPAASITKVDRLLRENAVSDVEPRVVMHPGTSENFIERRWPPEYFAELADQLIENLGARIIFTGIPQEGPLVKKILRMMKKGSLAIDATSGLSFADYICLVKASNLVISADTAAVHVASSLSVPVAGLYGPNTPLLYGPWGNQGISFYKKLSCSPCITNYNAKINTCRHPQGRGACMKQITPQEVFIELKRRYFEKGTPYRASGPTHA